MPYRFTMAFLDLFGRTVLRFVFQLFRFLASLTHGPFSFSCKLRTAEVSSYGKDPQALIVTWPHQGSHVPRLPSLRSILFIEPLYLQAKGQNHESR